MLANNEFKWKELEVIQRKGEGWSFSALFETISWMGTLSLLSATNNTNLCDITGIHLLYVSQSARMNDLTQGSAMTLHKSEKTGFMEKRSHVFYIYCS